MNAKDYLLIGQKTVIGDDVMFTPGYYDDGCSFGTIFKDERAFYEQPNEVCYIPEATFSEAEPVGVDLFCVEGYTRRDLEGLVEGEVDEEGEPISVEDFFHSLLCACPETYLAEMAM